MYEGYFGLQAHPFGMTPDPRFYYQSASHREAFAALKYGVLARRGFMILIGEVGTGKTTLINALLKEVDRSTCTILITHTTVNREELLRVILFKLYTAHRPLRPARGGEDGDADTRSRLAKLSRIELVNEFNAFVDGESMAFRPPPLLIIDEAQNLSPEVLEEVRLLTNLEGPKSKLLQVILAGQPELEDTLLRHELRQLRQRIAVRARLGPLTLEEAVGYVTHRLMQAGGQAEDLFSEEAIEAIWEASEGSARTINVLCDYALVSAFGSGEKKVDRTVANEAIEDVLAYASRVPSLKKPNPYLVTNLTKGRSGGTTRKVATAGDRGGRGE